MPSNWSKIRDEWLDRTAVAKDDAKWALAVSYTHLTLPTTSTV